MFHHKSWVRRKILKWLFGSPAVLVKYDYDPNDDRLAEHLGVSPELKYAKPGDAGLDLYYYGTTPIILKPGESTNVPSGLSVKIPEGYVGLLRCRSSTFTKRGLFVVHNTIDSGYTGAMWTTVWYPGLNGSQDHAIIQPWERLSQILVVPYLEAGIIEVSKMPTTERGNSGFGSSGR